MSRVRPTVRMGLARQVAAIVVTGIAALMLLVPESAPADQRRGGRSHDRDQGHRSTGPDIICSDIFNVDNYGVEGGIAAFAFGTRACNMGSMSVSWRDGTEQFPDSRHPVIAQNMYRLVDGRFEQIGMSWLKHGMCAVDGDATCAGCQDTGDCDILGVGCSDPYAAVLNGFQPRLSPRYQVNAANGSFPYPPADPSWSGEIARRLQVALSDLPPEAGPSDARYFVEAQYVAADDALWGNALNNVSYREVQASSNGITGFIGATSPGQPAVFAWQMADAAVQIVPVDIAGDGRFYLAYRVRTVSRNYEYEFALLNMNSNAAGHALAVPAPPGVSLKNIGFHDVAYHSGEPMDNTDWSGERLADEMRWSGQAFSINPNANALRWGTMYNFRFRTDRPPRSASVRLELFKPHTPSFVTVAAMAPTPMEDVNLDGEVDAGDVTLVIQFWATADGPADVNRSGVVDVFDLLAVLQTWGT